MDAGVNVGSGWLPVAEVSAGSALFNFDAVLPGMSPCLTLLAEGLLDGGAAAEAYAQGCRRHGTARTHEDKVRHLWHEQGGRVSVFAIKLFVAI